jgi:surface antigen
VAEEGARTTHQEVLLSSGQHLAEDANMFCINSRIVPGNPFRSWRGLAVAVPLVLVLAGCTADNPLAPSADAASPMLASATSTQKYGTLLGSFNGVNVYSNGSPGYFSGVTNTVNGYVTGYKWQCVEYIVRYYWQVYGRKIRGGNANDFYKTAASKGLKPYANGAAVGPQVGDILVSEGGPNGHVAIVREVGSNYVVVAQQNFYESATDVSTRLTLTVRTYTPYIGPPSRTYTVGGFSSTYPVRGWVRQ